MELLRKNRNRAACRRCQRRKIRVYYTSVMDKLHAADHVRRPAFLVSMMENRYIAKMEKRIKWLESMVQESCPNVDLTQGPSLEEPHVDEPIVFDEDRDENHILSPEQEHTMDVEHGIEQDRSQNLNVSAHPLRAFPRMESRQAHEVGLVSLSPGSEPRYIGPSSGYFFANLVFSNAGRNQQRRHLANDSTGSASGDPISLVAELLNAPASLPPRRQSTMELSSKYFQTIHVSYPFLHQPSHMGYVEQIYGSEQVSPAVAFQVYMVLAIAASDLSRRSKVRLPSEGFYSMAMQYFNQFCPDGSLVGLQSLLLLMIYALHNPSCGINIWNLNYQCLASLIDLGLQRDVRNTPSLQISLFEQEMRTRVFWVVYTFDRTIATMMGRPVGIRDEACDLRVSSTTAKPPYT
ncbi:hypothetical protein EYZ11_005894 [Aspergillus tanneri]|uniref:Xylanolytic transcriptional activator regulatory domain-containing protein n=1 Tax=Aspergillus tanneri TaxID=1220188 RepID=A0A4S3JGV8_9EURO|nr:hypothetical protein EYZ11_005894 [Aspergillus tanneri]